MSANPESIDALAAALRLVAIGGRELWGFDEIAAYSKLERNYIVNVITAKPGIPEADSDHGAEEPPALHRLRSHDLLREAPGALVEPVGHFLRLVAVVVIRELRSRCPTMRASSRMSSFLESREMASERES
jgi:hypothetical protein